MLCDLHYKILIIPQKYFLCKIDLSSHTFQGCSTAISNRKLVSFGIIDQMAHKSQNNLCIKQACRILTSLNQCGSHPQIPGRSLTGMTASLSYCGDVRTQSSVVRPLVFFPHLKRDTQRLQTCRSSLSPSP